MRLRDILSIINQEVRNIENITFSTDQIPNTAKVNYNISKLNTALASLEKLKTLDFLYQDIELLLSKYPSIMTTRQLINVEENAYKTIARIIEEIKSKCALASQILEQVVAPQDENTISFKLFKFENFEEYIKFCDDLNVKILNPINRLNIDIQLGELEAGSKWLSIVFMTSLGIMLFTSIARQSFDILIHDYQSYRIVNNMNKSLELEQDILEAYNKKLIEKIKKENEERSKQIVSELESDLKEKDLSDEELSELQNSVRISMELLSKYIDKGLEIYQAINVKEENRYQLPDFKQLLLAKEPQKLLGENIE
jgi:hypothetical protein